MINKNFSSHEIGLFSGATAAVVMLLTLVGVYLFAGCAPVLWLWIPGSMLSFAATYLVTVKLVNYFIYRRVKLIYKYIHQVKTDQEYKMAMRDSSDILESVEAEVRSWSDRQRTEIDTLRALEAYRRNFLGNISHELKTPIFNIQGYLHTLIEGALHDPAVNTKYLNRAAKNLERLETIVTDLETIAQLESEQMILEMDAFDIKALVKEVYEDHERLAAKKRIKLIFKAGADSDMPVMADRDRIRQVLNNLITNAIKYGRDEGYVKVSFYDMHDRVLIEVTDDGIGISEPHIKHVFDRFYRVDVHRSRELGGSGLGLSIVKHIIEAHKQGINVRSALGKGTTFGFTLAKAA
jgi:two-component system phosphate regulon sensor histidine kinase PhoR